jgi:hypothetical protein
MGAKKVIVLLFHIIQQSRDKHTKSQRTFHAE